MGAEIQTDEVPMSRNFYILSFGFGAMLLASHLAYAQAAQRCGSRPEMIRQLWSGYGEKRQAVALASNGVAVELFSSINTGSWTILSTSPDRVTCMIASGEAFELTLNPGGEDT